VDYASGALAPRALADTVSKLKGLIESTQAVSQHYLTAVGTVLRHELNQIISGQAASQRPARGGLAVWQLRVVTDYIEEHLSKDISLMTLARLVRISKHQFCRAFRHSLGRSPCRYHSLRRMEQAKLLLAEPNVTVAEVASRVGFDDTSVFTAAFRRKTGLTPTDLRRSLS
jgi:AraC family transcriptional regulator